MYKLCRCVMMSYASSIPHLPLLYRCIQILLPHPHSVFPPHKEISYFKERYSLSRRGGSNKHNINIYLFIYNMPGTLL